MPYYAQLNDGVAVAITESAGPLAGAGFVALQSLDASVLGRSWTGSAWEDVPPAAPVPATIDALALLDLLQSAGGMTDAQLVAARDDPALAAFWIKLQLARAILPDDARTAEGLAALQTLGYLPAGVPAVLAAWPTIAG